MRPVWCFAIITLFSACAQVRAPEGGPKDTEPPVLRSAVPANGSTNFSATRIVLQFNERVQLSRVRERLLISPPLAEMPQVSVVGGTKVVIDLGAPLDKNMTYTFNIGEAISDLSEGNPAQGLTYVVSTGDHLDSLSVEGTVVDAASDKPLPDVLVLLQTETDTGDVRSVPPNWFTRSNDQGHFILANLPPGRKRIYALRDRNGNYRYDLPNEDIAFQQQPVEPGEKGQVKLRMFTAPSPTQFVAQASVLPDRGWRLAMARPGSGLALRPLDREAGVLRWWPQWNTTRDTVVFWPSDTTLLNGERFALLADGSDIDTLVYRVSTPMPFYISVVAGEDQQGSPILRTSRPITGFDLGKAEMKMDTVPLPFIATVDSSDHRLLHLSEPTIGKSASLILLPGALISEIGGTNDTTRLRTGAADAKTLGKLVVELHADSGFTWTGPFILQLRTATDRVVREARVDSLPVRVHWDRLPTGPMTLRLIEDLNGDGHWTTGTFIPPKQPERVQDLPDPVVVRAGWAVEADWAVRGQH